MALFYSKLDGSLTISSVNVYKLSIPADEIGPN